MKVDYVYTIVEISSNSDFEIILATTSKRQAKVVLHELYEAISENSKLRVSVYNVGSYLAIDEYDEELDDWNWSNSYRVEAHPIVKQGYKSSLIEDKIKEIKSK